ncbi:ribosome small subunit-dependent GTPase A [Desulfonema ishimotonii]|uniref:Small ribosomal subunit biogenesis GTPase RsgA n=2 Tax=Desulfonema ishimotonii TaxID=45657 RepID=A0A401G282_9BACT|nr:ribosome small subunit-dependent GTPase A [Desulfonema ishimotonii]
MNNSHPLLPMGWDLNFETHPDLSENDTRTLARVTGVRKNRFHVSNGEKEWLATVSGRLIHRTDGLYPVTGDWVFMNDTVISEVLPRKNALSRGAAGNRGKQAGLATEEQVIAANLDTVFIVCGLDRDFNIRRIERYLTLVYNCGVNPAIILTKADLHPTPEHFVSEVAAVAFGVPIHPVSAKDSTGLAPLAAYLSPGRTIAMIGSSGAGKSTIVNRLSGKTVQATGSVSESLGKGKHTTTSRDLILMPGGGMVIDNPGIREIAFWDDEGGIDTAFPEIERLAGECRFSDCGHTHEPGCRVLHGVSTGEIRQDRLDSYHKMKRELAYLSQRQHKSADRVEKERWKGVAAKIKAMKKRSRNG